MTFSASGIGVRSPTAMSLVKWSPPTPMTAVCHRAAALEDGQVGRAAADVEQRHAEFALVGRQHRFGGRQLADDHVDHRDARPVHAGDEVLRGGGRAGDDVHVDLEPGAGHADRGADAVLLVDDEVLRQHVQDLAAGGQRHGPGGVEGAAHVLARDLAVLAGHGHDAAAVEALDVRTVHGQMRRSDLHAGHELGLLHRLLDGVDGGLEIHHDAALQALRLGHADADDVEPAAVRDLAHDRAHLRGADVEPDDVPLIPCHY